VNKEDSTLLLFGALASRFFPTTSLWDESAVYKRYAEKLGVPTVNWPECTPAIQRIQIFLAIFITKDVAKARQRTRILWQPRHSKPQNTSVLGRHIACSLFHRTNDSKSEMKAPDI